MSRILNLKFCPSHKTTLLLCKKLSTTSSNKMRFLQFKRKNGEKQLGVQLSEEDGIIEINKLNSNIPDSMTQFLRMGIWEFEKLDSLLRSGHSTLPFEGIEILPPITRPDKVICVGINYKKHCWEMKKPQPTEPLIFNKFPSCLIGPYDDIQLPLLSQKLDYEVELAVVIGKLAKCVNMKDANEYVFGYSIAQDISARDYQLEHNHGQWLLGKAMDTFCPLGPHIIPKQLVKYEDIILQTLVDGVLKQEGTTSDMIFKPEFIISYVSHFFTLYPGDLILTGTPSGSGQFKNPPEYLQEGNILETKISGIGKMKNKIVKKKV